MNRLSFISALLMITAIGCQSMPPIHTVDAVDIERFMGDWYVIAHIPAFIEKNAYNAVESYALNADGSIKTTFRFNKGGFDGPLKEYHPRGFVRDKQSNAVWAMQFIWPFKAEYRIVYLNAAYTQTIIGRTKRDYVWIMARSPYLPEAVYEKHVAFIQSLGYDIRQLRSVPQKSDE